MAVDIMLTVGGFGDHSDDMDELATPRTYVSSDTFISFERPYTSNQTMFVGPTHGTPDAPVEGPSGYVYNYGATDLLAALIRARLTTYEPPEVGNITDWLDNATRHILPRIQLSADGVTWAAMGAPAMLGPIYAGADVPFYVRYTSAVTDTRTGLAYDYGVGANTNDHPFAFALEVVGVIAQRRYPQLVGQ